MLIQMVIECTDIDIYIRMRLLQRFVRHGRLARLGRVPQ